jgi:hypothetical protein
MREPQAPLARFLMGKAQVRARANACAGRSGPGLPDHIRTSFPDQLTPWPTLGQMLAIGAGRGSSKGSGIAKAPGGTVEPIEHCQAFVPAVGHHDREALPGAG